MTPQPSRRRMPIGDKMTYALPALALAMVGIPVYVHIPKFYTDVVGVSITWVGTVLMAARLLDAVTDPLMGIVSDRTRSPMGRRRPFMLGGCIGLATAVVALFVPMVDEPLAASVWFTAAVIALFLFWTVVTVPYEALGPSLTRDYAERTSLFALRDGLLIAGTLLAAALPLLIESLQAAPATDGAQRQKFVWFAAIYVPLLIGTCLWCVARIREPDTARGDMPTPARRALKEMMHNRPFVILLSAYAIGAVGSNLPATLILYYVEIVLQSSRADLFLFLYFASGIVMLPVWIAVSGRLGKKFAWLASMAVNTLAFSGVYFLGAGDEWRYGVLVVISGTGFGATLALPSAIQADVIDYDELLTGRRQEGWYVGVWSVMKKLTAAIGVGIGLTVLGVAGYAPGPSQPPAVVQALKILYALVPCLCNAAAFAVALTFPISAPVHRRILDGIDLMKQGREAPDPLR